MDFVLRFASDYLLYGLVGFALCSFAATGDWRKLYIPALSFMLSSIISFWTAVPRPFVVKDIPPLLPAGYDGSFPSDHSSLAFGVAISHRIPLLWLLAFVVASSRIYAGVHWPGDIMGSLALVILVNHAVRRLYEIGNKNTSRGEKGKN